MRLVKAPVEILKPIMEFEAKTFCFPRMSNSKVSLIQHSLNLLAQTT